MSAPSRAATFLAWQLWHKITAQTDPAAWRKEAETMIQSALADLLEKAEAFRARHYNSIGARELADALEPWKAGE